jgi:EAL domain-containing protein (putative c-di-GMP-specific phosphodiesterase class I)
MQNVENAIETLNRLRGLGIEVSMDDFGTGYSSLSYLRRFPISTLKIDGSFVSQMSGRDENAEIVKTIVMLATNLGMDVVAEGIETEGQLAELQNLKCQYGQGYYFSRPLDVLRATDFLEKERSHGGWLVNQRDEHTIIECGSNFVS